MEGMVKHNEVISMQIFQTWKDGKVTVNGMSFEIYEENIGDNKKIYQLGNNNTNEELFLRDSYLIGEEDLKI